MRSSAQSVRTVVPLIGIIPAVPHPTIHDGFSMYFAPGRRMIRVHVRELSTCSVSRDFVSSIWRRPSLLLSTFGRRRGHRFSKLEPKRI